MTQLLNLESCSECYQYTLLLQQSPQDLIPKAGLPTAYKNFLRTYAHTAYLPQPVTCQNLSQNLIINSNLLKSLTIGCQLNEGSERLFIIRDTVDLMTLLAGGFISNQEKYLYASAYYYWNNLSQLSKQNIKHPLVFINLDSFDNEGLIPISFAQHQNSRHPVPILDTRKEKISFKFDSVKTYESILEAIAKTILNDNFSVCANDYSTIYHLVQYLQKTLLLQHIPANIAQKQIFNFIIEVLYQGKVFYKQANINLYAIQQIILDALDIRCLQSLATNNPQFQFILLTQYPVIAHLQTKLPDFTVLPSSLQEFSHIWQQKQIHHFPLFGFYLDTIEFAININGKPEWIRVSNSEENLISYEGEKRSFIGAIPSTGQKEFVIKQGITSVCLPIRVNGKDYCLNEVAQDYYIEVGKRTTSHDIKVSIEFHLLPDSAPTLVVIDLEDNSSLKTELKPHQIITYSYIQSQRISNVRYKQSEQQIGRLQVNVDSLHSSLSTVSRKVQNSQVNYTVLSADLKAAYNLLNKGSRNIDPLLFIDNQSSTLSVVKLQEILKENIILISEYLSKWINTSFSNRSAKPNDLEKTIQNAVILIGKTYHLTPISNAKILFAPLVIQQSVNCGFWGEYLKMLTRIAITEDLQRLYFDYFFQQYRNQAAYRLDNYLWGYWRILLWYADFKQLHQWLDYKQHFKLILGYLAQTNESQLKDPYKINAFACLIYLMTFREFDSEFCQPNSEEIKLALQVIELFKNDTSIKIRQVSDTKFLNVYFAELVAGIASESDMVNLLSAS